MSLTAERLREVLSYNPKNGLFVWIKPLSRRVKLGDVAGSLMQKGYITISIDGTRYLAHRLAFLYVTGEWPKSDVDHKNRFKTDNRFDNLREVDNRTNHENRFAANKSSKTGVAGVCPGRRGRFLAQIMVKGKRKWLGEFSTIAEASACYLAAKNKYHAGFIC